MKLFKKNLKDIHLLDEVENGTKLTKSQQNFHTKTKVRDIAILTLLLGTGIRVSECVGIDINDIDFKNTGIKIQRKGGYETIIYFGDEVEEALKNYMEERKELFLLKDMKMHSFFQFKENVWVFVL